MKNILLLNLLLILTIICRAQNEIGNTDRKNFILSGKLEDTLTKTSIFNATVSLIRVVDSSLVAFTRTDSSGKFSFTQLQAGRYRLSASHANFWPQWKNFDISAGEPFIDLGCIYLQDKTLLDELTVIAQRPAVEVNGDTLEFNSESFKTKPNAVVEDMLKKMPGVEVDRDGTVKVNGKKINRVLVNGKDFFNGDPKLATRNLAADAVDKVQVFDKLSDQAAFTGIDDGNAEKTINLKLKKDKKNAAFGKLNAAAGTQSRYDGQFNVNKFNNEQQLSAIGMANNTNRQGFSLMDMLNFTGQTKRMMGGGGGIVINTGQPEDFGLPVSGLNNKQGITTTIAGGLNYSDSWKNKTDINSSYFFNDQEVNNDKRVNRQYILPNTNFTWKQISSNSNKTQGNRFNFSADNKIDSFNSIKVTAMLGYQKGNIADQSNYGSFIPGGQLLNAGITNITNATEGYNTNNSILYRHKFRKKSRTLSVNANMQYTDSRMNGTQYSINNFYENGSIDYRDTLNQVSKLTSITQSYGVNVSYTEPLSKRSLLELRGFYTISSGNLDRETFDYNKTSGKHDVPNRSLSNTFESNYFYTGGGMSYRVQQKKYGFSAGANLQYASLLSTLRGNNRAIKQNFTSLLPLGNFNYSFTRTKTLKIDYNTSTSQPSPSQLQPVKDMSDPLNIREGNPFLQQEYSHNLSLQFFNANPARQKNLFTFFNYYSLHNAIVNNDMIDTTGTRITKPVNASGVYNLSAMVERGFRVKKINTRFRMGLNIGYNHTVNFVNLQKNIAGNLSVTPRVSATYTYKEILDIYLSARLSHNRSRYSLQSMLNNKFWRQTYSVEATLSLPAGFTVYNEFTYDVYTGRSNGYNTNVGLWNAAISKEVLKNKKGEIKLSGFDLLKQNVGVDRNANNNFIEDIQYRALQRYFTLGFTYSLQKAVKGGPRAVIRNF